MNLRIIKTVIAREYMTKVKKAYAYDKLFAVIIVISIVSLLLILVVRIIERKSMPYMHLDEEK